ncbi:MAG: phosphopentomutase [Bacillota bacterium]|uniref:Phosphopentomutase n=1 Tax=Thermanaerosceptrum fracticalcis TaxID=1712410 RepID=A0A7G6E0G2_THEFR|nr:phosphopentomutase [Thermanaerosceptrum fracticalcis]QNB45566.1 phosphopentomutase [Thermanaerosceptrum fracticalcis]
MTKTMLIVMDSVGIGALPDAHLYGDEGSNTLVHIAEAVKGLKLPNLARLGLGKITDIPGVPGDVMALGGYGRMAELSKGKDTTTGHWELSGILTRDPMPTFPQGFPPEIITAFEKLIKRKVLGNKVASGTEIIKELGEEHMRTGFPIVYTSADSVFQIAAHEEVIPLPELYEMCKKARSLLTGPWAVGRVIARPFAGRPGDFTRTANRHDYSLLPPEPTVLDALKSKGEEVIAVGKIYDIFAGQGLTRSFPTKSNNEGMEKTLELWGQLKSGLIFTNLVEFDATYGHRNNPVGYAKALEEMDAQLKDVIEAVAEDGWLFITADHGNDPTTASTDHSREYVPLLVYGKGVKRDVNLGTRRTFADVAATLSELYHLDYTCVGESFLPELLHGNEQK